MPIPGSPVIDQRSPPVPSRAARASSRTTASSRSRPTTRRLHALDPSCRHRASPAERSTDLAATGARPSPSARAGPEAPTRRAAPRERRCLPHEDGARARLRLEPRRHVHGVAHRRRTPRGSPRRRPRPPRGRTRRRPGRRTRRCPSAARTSSRERRRSPRRSGGRAERASGSSSWATGAPKSASTPSPARSLIVPPKASTAATIRADGVPDHQLQLLGLEPLSESRRPDEVGEQRGHEPPFLTHSRLGSVTAASWQRRPTETTCRTIGRDGRFYASLAVGRDRTRHDPRTRLRALRRPVLHLDPLGRADLWNGRHRCRVGRLPLGVGSPSEIRSPPDWARDPGGRRHAGRRRAHDHRPGERRNENRRRPSLDGVAILLRP